MDRDGRVPLGALVEALKGVAGEWGFSAEALDEVRRAGEQRSAGPTQP
jgi:hypothetical protein